MMRIKDAMAIEGAEGNRLAMVRKALVSPIRHRWTVSKKWFRVAHEGR